MLDRVGGVLGNVGSLVRSCHERFGGGGYPDGLVGDEIPLVARIVCCCDAVQRDHDRPALPRGALRRGGARGAPPLRGDAVRPGTWSTALARGRRRRPPSGIPITTREVDSAAVKVLLVGSGGREHALAWKLAQAPALDVAACRARAIPGSPRLGDCHPVRAEDGESLLGLARSLDIDLVVIGPEAPLVAGVADLLRRNGVAVFGPGRSAARIEGSKTFAKDVLAAAGVPTAETLAVARPPCVVKVDGLAAGKGVFVCQTAEQLDEGLRAAAALPGARS